MSAKPFFPFYPGDYLADTMGLSCCEHGVYLLLLAVSWQRGPLPDDMDHLARLAANPPIEALRYILSTYWTLTEQGWLNKRLESERQKLESRFARQSAAGKRAIEARWGKKRDAGQSVDTKRIGNEYVRDTNQNQNQIEETHATHESAKTAVSARQTACPYEEIRRLWIEVLPELRQPIGSEHWTDARKAMIRNRWRDQLPDLESWRECFELVRKSDFLMGRVTSRGRKPFSADLFWISKPENLLKIYEGKYHA